MLGQQLEQRGISLKELEKEHIVKEAKFNKDFNEFVIILLVEMNLVSHHFVNVVVRELKMKRDSKF